MTVSQVYAAAGRGSMYQGTITAFMDPQDDTADITSWLNESFRTMDRDEALAWFHDPANGYNLPRFRKMVLKDYTRSMRISFRSIFEYYGILDDIRAEIRSAFERYPNAIIRVSEYFGLDENVKYFRRFLRSLDIDAEAFTVDDSSLLPIIGMTKEGVLETTTAHNWDMQYLRTVVADRLPHDKHILSYLRVIEGCHIEREFRDKVLEYYELCNGNASELNEYFNMPAIVLARTLKAMHINLRRERLRPGFLYRYLNITRDDVVRFLTQGPRQWDLQALNEWIDAKRKEAGMREQFRGYYPMLIGLDIYDDFLDIYAQRLVAFRHPQKAAMSFGRENMRPAASIVTILLGYEPERSLAAVRRAREIISAKKEFLITDRAGYLLDAKLGITKREVMRELSRGDNAWDLARFNEWLQATYPITDISIIETLIGLDLISQCKKEIKERYARPKGSIVTISKAFGFDTSTVSWRMIALFNIRLPHKREHQQDSDFLSRTGGYEGFLDKEKARFKQRVAAETRALDGLEKSITADLATAGQGSASYQKSLREEEAYFTCRALVATAYNSSGSVAPLTLRGPETQYYLSCLRKMRDIKLSCQKNGRVVGNEFYKDHLCTIIHPSVGKVAEITYDHRSFMDEKGRRVEPLNILAFDTLSAEPAELFATVAGLLALFQETTTRVITFDYRSNDATVAKIIHILEALGIITITHRVAKHNGLFLYVEANVSPVALAQYQDQVMREMNEPAQNLPCLSAA
jgi:hypothetical protein